MKLKASEDTPLDMGDRFYGGALTPSQLTRVIELLPKVNHYDVGQKYAVTVPQPQKIPVTSNQEQLLAFLSKEVETQSYVFELAEFNIKGNIFRNWVFNGLIIVP